MFEGASIRLPAAGLSWSDLADSKNFALAQSAVRNGIFTDIILPPLEYTDRISQIKGSKIIPSFSGREQQQEVLRTIQRLQPDHALIVNDFEAFADDSRQSFIFDLVKFLNQELASSDSRECRLWADMHLNGAGIEPIKPIFAAGFDGIIAGPPFLDRRFQENLDQFCLQKMQQHGQLLVGVPYIDSSSTFKKWLKLMDVSIAENPAAQNILELFQRAEIDGRIQHFRQEWNRAMFEWCQNLIGVENMHFIFFSHLDEGIKIVEQATRVQTTSPSREFLVDTRFARADFIQQMQSLNYPISTTIANVVLSEEKLPNSEITYSQECLPKLPEIVKAFEFAQLGSANNIFWEGLSASIERPVLVGLARGFASLRKFYDSQSDYLNNLDKGKYQVLINLRPGLLPKSQAFHKLLTDKLISFSNGIRSSSKRYEIKGSESAEELQTETSSALHRLGMEGYIVLRRASEMDYITLPSKTPKVSSAGLFDSAKNEYVINQSAKLIAQRLKSTDIKDPVIIEPGSYQANGIPEMLAELEILASKDSALKTKLPPLTIVLSDFNDQALKTSKDVLGEEHRSGIKFQYLLLDSTADVETIYRDAGLLKRIIGGRAINVLDAVGSDYIAYIDGEFYRVAARTFLNADTLNGILDKEFIDHKPQSNANFKFKDFSISTEDIISILNQNSDTASVNRFLEYCETKELPEHRAFYLWKCIYESLEQDHDYVKTDISQIPWIKDSNGKSLNYLLEEVLKSHPGNHMIPDTARAIGVLQGILPLLENGAEFVVTNLTTSLKDSRTTFHGWRSYGVTFAMPAAFDLIRAWAESQGYKVKRVFGSEFKIGKDDKGMTNSNSLLSFTKA